MCKTKSAHSHLMNLEFFFMYAINLTASGILVIHVSWLEIENKIEFVVCFFLLLLLLFGFYDFCRFFFLSRSCMFIWYRWVRMSCLNHTFFFEKKNDVLSPRNYDCFTIISIGAVLNMEWSVCCLFFFWRHTERFFPLACPWFVVFFSFILKKDDIDGFNLHEIMVCETLLCSHTLNVRWWENIYIYIHIYIKYTYSTYQLADSIITLYSTIFRWKAFPDFFFFSRSVSFVCVLFLVPTELSDSNSDNDAILYLH